MAVIGAFRRCESVRLRDFELASRERPRRVGAFDPLETNEPPRPMSAPRRDDEGPALASAPPLQARAPGEALRKIGRDLDGNLAGEAVRPADEADEENGEVSRPSP
jgi:hypothetical protein